MHALADLPADLPGPVGRPAARADKLSLTAEANAAGTVNILTNDIIRPISGSAGKPTAMTPAYVIGQIVCGVSNKGATVAALDGDPKGTVSYQSGNEAPKPNAKDKFTCSYATLNGVVGAAIMVNFEGDGEVYDINQEYDMVWHVQLLRVGSWFLLSLSTVWSLTRERPQSLCYHR